MRPTSKTIRYLVRLASELVISEKTILLYLYYCTCGNDTPLRNDIQKGTGLALTTIRTHDRVLEALGLLVRGRSTGRGKGVQITLFNVEKPTTPPSSSLTNIIDIKSQKDLRRHFGSNGSIPDIYNSSRGGSGRLSAWDIAHDEDFLRAKKALLKRFQEFEIDPVVLLKKNRFATLVDILTEEGFDFEGYCEWFFKNKYPIRGFNYGLFLYPRMVAEYRHWISTNRGRGTAYHKPKDSLERSDSFQNGVERTKKFLSELEDGDK